MQKRRTKKRKNCCRRNGRRKRISMKRASFAPCLHALSQRFDRSTPSRNDSAWRGARWDEESDEVKAREKYCSFHVFCMFLHNSSKHFYSKAKILTRHWFVCRNVSCFFSLVLRSVFFFFLFFLVARRIELRKCYETRNGCNNQRNHVTEQFRGINKT